MPAYILSVEQETMDEAGRMEYITTVRPTVEAHGGRFVGVGTPECLEGDWKPSSIAMIEFPSVEAAKGLLGAEEYQPYKELREKSFRTNIVVLDGTDRDADKV